MYPGYNHYDDDFYEDKPDDYDDPRDRGMTMEDEDGCPEFDDMSGDFEEEDEEPSRDVGFTDEDKEAFAIADAIDSIEDD
jgi:hypothetical protein